MVLLLATLLLVGSPLDVLAEDPTPQGSPNPAIIVSQLRSASQLGRQVLEGLKSLPSDESVDMDPSTLRKAKMTYGLLRAAKHGIELKKQTDRFPDPTLDLALKRVDEAFNLARIPVDKYSWGLRGEAYLSLSIPSMTRAVQLTDQALLFFP
jgi:hypothetical protein